VAGEPIQLRPAPPDEDDEDKLGCMDILMATGGMGCAMSVRGLIIVGAMLILYVVFRLVGGGGTSYPNVDQSGSGRILHQALDGWPFLLAYFLYFQKELGGRLVNKLHRPSEGLNQADVSAFTPARQHVLDDVVAPLAV